MINFYKPFIGIEEKKKLLDCLKSSWISSKGKYIELFENKFSTYTKIKYCATTTNGTTALHLALLSLEFKSGDEILVPSFTYIASVNCIKYLNAKVVFVDSDIDNYQIDINDLKKKISRKTKAIICPHLYGNACDIDELKKIKKKYKVAIIEDCAEAIGTFYRRKHVGGFFDVSTFSFFGSKTITTGEGGMVCSNNKKIINKVKKLRGQGLQNENKYYWHDVIGYNYRMTNLCASIGVAQLSKIKKILKIKKKIANFYLDHLKNLPIKFIKTTPHTKNSYWLFTIMVKNSSIKNSLIKFLKDKKIETRPFFHLVSNMPMYSKEKIQFAKSFRAEKISRLGICLPSHPNLTTGNQLQICQTIIFFFKKLNE
jgi:perosamine synthetase